MRKLFSSVGLVFGVAVAIAQAPQMGPSAEVKALGWMLGTWSGESSWDMQGQKMSCKNTMTVSFDGQFLKVVGVSDFGMMKVNETQYIGWDPAKKRYEAWAFTDMTARPRIEWGSMKKGVLTMYSEPWMTDPSMPPTESMTNTSLKSKDEVAFALYFKNGKKWEHVTTMRMKKQ